MQTLKFKTKVTITANLTVINHHYEESQGALKKAKTNKMGSNHVTFKTHTRNKVSLLQLITDDSSIQNH